METLSGRSLAVNYVLDACAMIALLRDEDGADIVDGILFDTDNICFAHSINLCEVYYEFHRASGEQIARAAIADIRQIGIQERTDMNPPLREEAGRPKALYRRISLADCFAAALANRLAAQVLTSDRSEFSPVSESGGCRVQFIR